MFLLLSFLLWDRERIIRYAWAASERRDLAMLESQRNAAHDIKNDLQEVVGLVSAYDQELISRGNSNNNVDRVLEDPNPNGGHSPSSSNGGLAIQYIEEDPREIYAVPERSTSAGALGGKDTWRTQSELRALAKVQHTPLRKTVLQRKVNASRDGPFQTLTTGETRLGTDHLSTTTRGTKKKKTSSSTKFNQRNSPLDLDVSSRVARAASRITTRLESNLRDTRTTIQRKLLVPTIKACDCKFHSFFILFCDNFLFFFFSKMSCQCFFFFPIFFFVSNFCLTFFHTSV